MTRDLEKDVPWGNPQDWDRPPPLSASTLINDTVDKVIMAIDRHGG